VLNWGRKKYLANIFGVDKKRFLPLHPLSGEWLRKREKRDT